MKMTYTIEQLKDYLKRHDIKPSTIRIKVLEYLLNNRIHPTADDIYQYLISEIPTLSKPVFTTHWNCLWKKEL